MRIALLEVVHIEPMEKILKLILEHNSPYNASKDVGYSHLIVSKIWSKYKTNGLKRKTHWLTTKDIIA